MCSFVNLVWLNTYFSYSNRSSNSLVSDRAVKTVFFLNFICTNLRKYTFFLIFKTSVFSLTIKSNLRLDGGHTCLLVSRIGVKFPSRYLPVSVEEVHLASRCTLCYNRPNDLLSSPFSTPLSFTSAVDRKVGTYTLFDICAVHRILYDERVVLHLPPQENSRVRSVCYIQCHRFYARDVTVNAR